ncbi:MAG: hypothetical protein AB1757_08835 [Acidobacteriota bacterium]
MGTNRPQELIQPRLFQPIDRFAYLIATGFGAGLMPKAPNVPGALERVVAIFYVLMLLSFGNPSFARNEDEVGAKPKPIKLPGAFVAFSNDDVLKKTFSDYDIQTGRISSRLNENNQPSLVRINQARLWRVKGQEHLVALIDIAGADHYFKDLCGNCGIFATLVVLKRAGNQLVVVAKQPPNQSMPSDFSRDRTDAIYYTGHDPIVSLDLAPYKLTDNEMLIGFRVEHMWLPARTWDVYLSLYRIEGDKLREVFSESVVERRYPGENPQYEVVKSVSELSPLRLNSKFYDYEIRKTVTHCFDKNDDADCTVKADKITRIEKQTELWRFNGARFEKIK